jgi:WhiB family redox-sensing transcriptional regulator
MPDWTGALCGQTDPALFMRDGGGAQVLVAAKRTCNGTSRMAPCPLKAECLEYALATDERFGVWGGMGPRERDIEAARRRARVDA